LDSGSALGQGQKCRSSTWLFLPIDHLVNMLTLHGFSACIESNGAPLPEYLVSVDEKASRVSCWIPGVEGQVCFFFFPLLSNNGALKLIFFGKLFKVNWTDEGSKVSTCAFIILDGVVVPGRFLHGEGAASRGGVRVSKTTERPFVFSKVKQTGIFLFFTLWHVLMA